MSPATASETALSRSPFREGDPMSGRPMRRIAGSEGLDLLEQARTARRELDLRRRRPRAARPRDAELGVLAGDERPKRLVGEPLLDRVQREALLAREITDRQERLLVREGEVVGAALGQEAALELDAHAVVRVGEGDPHVLAAAQRVERPVGLQLVQDVPRVVGPASA